MKKLHILFLLLAIGGLSTELIYPILGTRRREALYLSQESKKKEDAAYQAGLDDAKDDSAYSDEELKYANDPSYNAPRYEVQSAVSENYTDDANVLVQTMDNLPQGNGADTSNMGGIAGGMSEEQRTAMKAKLKAKMQEKNSDGKMSQEQRAAMRAKIKARMLERMGGQNGDMLGQNGHGANPMNTVTTAQSAIA